MPPAPTVKSRVAFRYSDQDILARVAEVLTDGSMAFKVDLVGGLTLETGDINIGAVNILNAADVQINPSTEETSQAMLSALGGAAGSPVHVFDEATSVPSATPTDVLSYTVPSGQTLYVKHATGTGTNYAVWRLKIDSTVVAVRRASDGRGLDVDFDFSDDSNKGGLPVSGGSTVTLEVEHARPFVGDFQADLTGRLA